MLKRIRSPFTLLAATLVLLPNVALYAASGDTIIEGEGTIEIVQTAEIANAMGSWTLIRPDNSQLKLNQSSRYINEEAPSGQYTLLIDNADGATVTITLWKNGDIVSTSPAPKATFVVSDGDVYLIEADYKYTITGKVSVTSQPPGVSFTIRGPNAFQEDGVTPASFQSAPIGLYSVQYNPPEGCPKTNAKSDTLQKDGRVSFAIELACEALDTMTNQANERLLNFVTLTVGIQKIVLEDVPISAWFATHVHKVAKTGIMSGYKDEAGDFTGMFGPGDSVSIAQLAKVAHKIAGIDETEIRAVPVNPLAEGTWFEDFYASAEQRYWQVFLDPTLDPGRPATRAEVISTLMQALDVPRVWPKGELFRDVLPSAPYAASIETAALDGIVSSETNAFRPNDPINRAELAKIITVAIDTYIADSPEFTGSY